MHRRAYLVHGVQRVLRTPLAPRAKRMPRARGLALNMLFCSKHSFLTGKIIASILQ